jgi:hypothetical protein
MVVDGRGGSEGEERGRGDESRGKARADETWEKGYGPDRAGDKSEGERGGMCTSEKRVR